MRQPGGGLHPKKEKIRPDGRRDRRGIKDLKKELAEAGWVRKPEDDMLNTTDNCWHKERGLQERWMQRKQSREEANL
jgi:hypothetical protein